MKLLIWVTFAAVGLALPTFIEEWLKSGSGNKRFGRLSEAAKLKLKENFGNIDPEKRRERLHRLSSRIAARNLTQEEKAKISVIRDKIRRVKFERPSENDTTDLFELNQKLGVDDYMYEGDIFLTDEQLQNIEQSESADGRSKRQATLLYAKWTDNTVNYYFDPSINDRKKTAVANAFEYIRSRTCINFQETDTAPSRIKIFSGSGCYATVGMLSSEQSMSLGDGCESLRTVVHETFHSLGVFHMQSRSDRDTYVTIDLSDVPEERHHNFNKYTEAQTINYTPYEYGSAMQYGAGSFTETAGSVSIIPVDDKYLYTMGSPTISLYDIMIVNTHYDCDALCPPATSAQCKNGGKPNPRNCAKCNCPIGYGGTLCNERPAGCGEMLTATTEWQLREFEFGVDNTTVRDLLTYCHDWITAPENTQIEIRMTYMYNSQCQFGCPFNGIELKVEAEQQKTNPRTCCTDSYGVIQKSQLNPTPVIAYNRYYITRFKYEYRHVPATPTTTTVATTTTTSTTTTAPTTTTPTTTTTSSTTTTPTTTTTTTPTSTTTATTTAPLTTTTTPSTTTSVTTTTTTATTTTTEPTTTEPTTTTSTTTTTPTTTTPTTTTPRTTTPTTTTPTTTTSTTTTTTPTTTTTTTTPAPTTTTKTTTPATTTPKLITQCRNIYPDTTCSNMDKLGFCSSTTYTFQVKKYNCGKYCGLCGKKANPCVDIKTDCAAYKAEGKCNSQIPMVAEYNCAKTCGFCQTPN